MCSVCDMCTLVYGLIFLLGLVLVLLFCKRVVMFVCGTVFKFVCYARVRFRFCLVIGDI